MSALQVPCPACQTKLRIANESLWGKKIRCPRCQAVVAVPVPPASTDVADVEAEPPAPPRPSAGVQRKPPPRRAPDEGARRERRFRPDEEPERRGPGLLIVLGLLALLGLGGAGVAAYFLFLAPASSVASKPGGGNKNDGKMDDDPANDVEEAPEADPPLEEAEVQKRTAARLQRAQELRDQEAQLIARLAQKPATPDQRLELLAYRGAQPTAMTFSPDGKLLALADELGNREVCMLTLETGAVRKFGKHEGWVGGLAFSPDSSMLVTGTSMKELHLWDVASGEQRKSFVGHRDGISAALFTSDGKRLITAAGLTKSAEVRVWNVETGKLVRLFKDPALSVTGLALSPDDRTLAIGLFSRKVVFWNIRTGAVGDTLTVGFETAPVAFAPDGKSFAFASGTFVGVQPVGAKKGLELSGAGKGYKSLAFTPDGKLLMAGSPNDYAFDNADVRFWDAASGELRAHWGGVIGKQYSLFDMDRLPVLSPGGRLLAARRFNDQIKVWDLDDVLDPGLARLFNEIEQWGQLSVRDGGVEIMGYPDQTNDQRVIGLKGIKKLRKVSVLASDQLTEAAFRALRDLPGLRSLQLTSMKNLDDAALKDLAQCRQLDELILDSCRQVTDAGLDHLNGMPHLRKLRVSFTGVSAAGAERFQKNNPTVQVER
jgi:predicted Zn finger-like uncharacterized protein